MHVVRATLLARFPSEWKHDFSAKCSYVLYIIGALRYNNADAARDNRKSKWTLEVHCASQKAKHAAFLLKTDVIPSKFNVLGKTWVLLRPLVVFFFRKLKVCCCGFRVKSQLWCYYFRKNKQVESKQVQSRSKQVEASRSSCVGVHKAQQASVLFSSYFALTHILKGTPYEEYFQFIC